MGPDGLPEGQPGKFVETPDALTGPEGRPAELPPGEGREGFNEFNPAPAEFDGYFKPQQRRPDIQPQRQDPTTYGEQPPIVDPLADYKAAKVDPNAQTHIGETYLDPVDADTGPLPVPKGPRPAPDAIDRRIAAKGYDSTTAQDMQAIRTQDVDVDPSAAATQTDLGPASRARAEQATEPSVQPLTPKGIRPNVTPESSGVTTQLELPVPRHAPKAAKPGADFLSPEAQELIARLKPGERAALQKDLDHLRKYPDSENGQDALNLQMALDGIRAKAAKPGEGRPKGEPLASGEGKTRTPRNEADLVQAGFRSRDGKAPPKDSVDAQAKTEEIAPLDTSTPKANSKRVSVEERVTEPRKTDGPQEMTNFSGPSPEAFTELAKYGWGAAKGISRAGKSLFDKWSKRIVKVVEDAPGGAEAGAKARTVIARTRELQGKLDPDRQRFIKAVRGRGEQAKAARASFDEVDWDGDAGFARINDVLDGEVKPRPHEEPAVKAYRQAFLDSGRMAESAKYEIDGQRFTADPERQRAPRIATRDLRWYSSHPGDAESVRLAETIAEYNPGMTKESVLREMNLWNQKGVTKRGMAEDAREIEHFPTHYRDSEGNLVQLLETDPQKIIDAVTRNFPKRVAYVESFTQKGTPKELQSLVDTGHEGAAKDLFRSLNGIPLDDFGMDIGSGHARPGSAEAVSMRALEVPWTLWKGLKLSLAPLANAPETIGKARSITGGSLLNAATGRDAARMAKAGFDVSFLNRNSDALVDDLANRGLLTRDMMDWYYNRSNRTETVNRYVLNTTGAINQAVNEFNEKLAARLADTWSKQLKASEGSSVDRFRLKVLDFRPDEIKSIMDGKASDKVYSEVAARAVEWAQGSTSQGAERSRAGNSRLWNFATIADRFAQMNVNRNFDAWAKAAKALAEPGASWADRVAGVRFAADLTAGQTAAASLTLAARAMLVGAGGVLADKVTNGALSDFLLDAAKMSLLGGPVQSVANSMDRDEESWVADSIAHTLLPLSTLQSVSNFLTGSGKFEGMTTLEGAAELLRSNTPAAKAVANVLAVTGIAKDDPNLDAAISAFYDWKGRHAPGPQVSGGSPETSEFRVAMRKAAKAMQDGVDPGPAVHAALKAKDGKAVRASLLAKRLIKDLKPEQQKNLRSYLGARTMMRLEQYDALLEAWAAVAYRPKRN
jgi:hypothetical protein